MNSHSEDEILQAFSRHVPEVANGVLVFKKVAREPGKMAYIAVEASAAIPDPIGLLCGRQGVHIKAVVSELGGEFVNLVRWDGEPEKFIQNAIGIGESRSVPGDKRPFESELHLNVSNRCARIVVDKKTYESFTANGGLRLRLVSELVEWNITLEFRDETSGA
jgi:N utilization substance protein A